MIFAAHIRHIVDRLGQTAADDIGYRVATINTLLWRTCASDVLNSRTGHST